MNDIRLDPKSTTVSLAVVGSIISFAIAAVIIFLNTRNDSEINDLLMQNQLEQISNKLDQMVTRDRMDLFVERLRVMNPTIKIPDFE